jgi:hypothetical protein
MRYIFFLFLFILFSCKPTNNLVGDIDIKNKNLELVDSDGDGVLDKYDRCPDIKGTNETGCPEEVLYSLLDTCRVEVVKSEVLKDEEPKNITIKNTSKDVKKKVKSNNVEIVQPKKEVRPKGLIAYSVPDQMEVGQEYSVKVRISKQNDKTVLLVGDREIPISDNIKDVKVESITVSPIMSASLLSSKKDFEITPLSTDIQNIDDEGYTEWAWSVSPLQGGENNLKLNVKIRIKEDGNDYYKDITVFERKIKVKSNLGSSIKDFVFNNWEWFMGAIFIPIFQWLWLLWKRKKEEKDV